MTQGKISDVLADDAPCPLMTKPPTASTEKPSDTTVSTEKRAAAGKIPAKIPPPPPLPSSDSESESDAKGKQDTTSFLLAALVLVLRLVFYPSNNGP